VFLKKFNFPEKVLDIILVILYNSTMNYLDYKLLHFLEKNSTVNNIPVKLFIPYTWDGFKSRIEIHMHRQEGLFFGWSFEDVKNFNLNFQVYFFHDNNFSIITSKVFTYKEYEQFCLSEEISKHLKTTSNCICTCGIL
jgi:hypothetical protein